MIAADPTRLDRLEALAETILLSIQALSQKQDRTQEQLDRTQGHLDQTQGRLDRTQAQIDRFAEQTDRKFEAIEEERKVLAEQTALNAAGMVELRNLIADFIRIQTQ